MPINVIENREWWLLALSGIIFFVLPHTLFAHGLLHLKAKNASLIACVRVFYSAVFAFVFLGELLPLNVIVGGLIVVAVTMFESLPKNKT